MIAHHHDVWNTRTCADPTPYDVTPRLPCLSFMTHQWVECNLWVGVHLGWVGVCLVIHIVGGVVLHPVVAKGIPGVDATREELGTDAAPAGEEKEGQGEG